MSGKLQLQDIATSVGSQLASADAALRSSQSELRLSSLALRLQGSAAVVEDLVGLDLSSPVGGSAVDFTFHAAGGGSIPGSPVAVPDVRGYTPALARRKLQAAGLSVAMTAVGNATGRVTEQQPVPGAQALPGTLVQIVLR
jgi:PASTA domain